MPKSINKVILVGNLGKDPEVNFTRDKTKVASFSIATNDRYKDNDGNWKDRTEWHNVVAWDKLADVVEQYCKKGSTVYIEGHLRTEKWEDKNQDTHWTTKIHIYDLVLFPSGSHTKDEFNQEREAVGVGKASNSTDPFFS